MPVTPFIVEWMNDPQVIDAYPNPHVRLVEGMTRKQQAITAGGLAVGGTAAGGLYARKRALIKAADERIQRARAASAKEGSQAVKNRIWNAARKRVSIQGENKKQLDLIARRGLETDPVTKQLRVRQPKAHDIEGNVVKAKKATPIYTGDKKVVPPGYAKHRLATGKTKAIAMQTGSSVKRTAIPGTNKLGDATVTLGAQARDRVNSQVWQRRVNRRLFRPPAFVVRAFHKLLTRGR